MKERLYSGAAMYEVKKRGMSGRIFKKTVELEIEK
jgi:hypothetical protein